MMSHGIMAGHFRTRRVLLRTESLLWWECPGSDRRDYKGVRVFCISYPVTTLFPGFSLTNSEGRGNPRNEYELHCLASLLER